MVHLVGSPDYRLAVTGRVARTADLHPRATPRPSPTRGHPADHVRRRVEHLAALVRRPGTRPARDGRRRARQQRPGRVVPAVRQLHDIRSQSFPSARSRHPARARRERRAVGARSRIARAAHRTEPTGGDADQMDQDTDRDVMPDATHRPRHRPSVRHPDHGDRCHRTGPQLGRDTAVELSEVPRRWRHRPRPARRAGRGRRRRARPPPDTCDRAGDRCASHCSGPRS